MKEEKLEIKDVDKNYDKLNLIFETALLLLLAKTSLGVALFHKDLSVKLTSLALGGITGKLAIDNYHNKVKRLK